MIDQHKTDQKEISDVAHTLHAADTLHGRLLTGWYKRHLYERRS